MVCNQPIACPCRATRHSAPAFMLSRAASEGRGKDYETVSGVRGKDLRSGVRGPRKRFTKRRPRAAGKIYEAASEGRGKKIIKMFLLSVFLVRFISYSSDFWVTYYSVVSASSGASTDPNVGFGNSNLRFIISIWTIRVCSPLLISTL